MGGEGRRGPLWMWASPHGMPAWRDAEAAARVGGGGEGEPQEKVEWEAGEGKEDAAGKKGTFHHSCLMEELNEIRSLDHRRKNIFINLYNGMYCRWDLVFSSIIPGSHGRKELPI